VLISLLLVSLIVVLRSLSIKIAHEFFVEKKDFFYRQPEVGFEIYICYASNPQNCDTSSAVF
jgi:hypothetical protein